MQELTNILFKKKEKSLQITMLHLREGLRNFRLRADVEESKWVVEIRRGPVEIRGQVLQKVKSRGRICV